MGRRRGVDCIERDGEIYYLNKSDDMHLQHCLLLKLVELGPTRPTPL
jgi:hypothetical protein